MKHINIPLFIPQAGCPFQCIFCQQRRISHEGPAPEPSQIPAIIEQCLSTIDPDQSIVEAAFFGGSFTALPLSRQKQYLDAVQTFLKKGRLDSIRISTRPDCIDQEVLDLLGERGVGTIELGVQSYDDDVLIQSGRGYRAARVLDACRLIKSGGFKLGIQLMIGLPGDDFERDLNSARTAVGQRPDMVRIYPTLVIAGTQLEDLYRNGGYQPLSMEEAVAICMEMYLLFQARSIPVIRMGLHPGEELRRPGSIIAGPFHPAFGELVEQAIFKKQAIMLLARSLETGRPNLNPRLQVNDRDLSKMLGWKRSNLMQIKDHFKLKSLQVKGNRDIPGGEIQLDGDEFNPAPAVIKRQELWP